MHVFINLVAQVVRISAEEGLSSDNLHRHYAVQFTLQLLPRFNFLLRLLSLVFFFDNQFDIRVAAFTFNRSQTLLVGLELVSLAFSQNRRVSLATASVDYFFS